MWKSSGGTMPLTSTETRTRNRESAPPISFVDERVLCTVGKEPRHEFSAVPARLCRHCLGGSRPPPATPGSAYTPPEHPTAEAAPLIYAFTEEAGPDQSFLLVGEGLTDQVEAWCAHPTCRRAGDQAQSAVCDGKLLIATLPDQCYDGPIVVWVKNQAGWSARWCSTSRIRGGAALMAWRRETRTVCGRSSAAIWPGDRIRRGPLSTSRNRANQDAGRRDGIAASGKTTPRSSAGNNRAQRPGTR